MTKTLCNPTIWSMKLLLHICCGPCALYPVEILREKGHNPVGFFFNPNIHPFTEFERRVKALEQVSEHLTLPVIWEGSGYGLHTYLRQIGDNTRQERRCPICYRMRLERTAELAAQKGFRAFSTTLLYSRYQIHELIREMGREIASRFNLDFFYHDFREGWTKGIEASRSLNIYRQPYCGCIFSEQERYQKKAERMKQRWSHESSI